MSRAPGAVVIGGDHQGIRAGVAKALDRARVAECLGLPERQALAFGKLLDRALERALSAARRPVGLSNHQRDVVAGRLQRGERPLSELRRAGED